MPSGNRKPLSVNGISFSHDESKHIWYLYFSRISKRQRKSLYDFMFLKGNHIIFKSINKDAWEFIPCLQDGIYF